MKFYSKILSIFILLAIIITINSCKKDAITVEESMEYHEKIIVGPNGGNTGLYVILRQNSEADIIENSDKAMHGTYNIRGKRLIVTVPRVRKYKFEIVSEGELRGDNGKVLILLRPMP